MQYRRTKLPGATYFFTVNLAERDQTHLASHIDALRTVVRTVRHHHPFQTVAWVVLPEHTHTIWTLPEGDADYSNRWSQIKGSFSRALPAGERVSASRRSKRERGIWQRRFWEHLIRDDCDLNRLVDYIHYNPVKHGYVERVADWPYSSFHHYVAKGWLEPGWGCGMTFEGDFGERGC